MRMVWNDRGLADLEVMASPSLKCHVTLGRHRLGVRRPLSAVHTKQWIYLTGIFFTIDKG